MEKNHKKHDTHHCGCHCGCGEHTHEYDTKYQEVLSMYETQLDEQQVKDKVKEICQKIDLNDNVETKKFLFGSIELTSLNNTDTEEKILQMIEKVNDMEQHFCDLPHVATVCVYPTFAELVHRSLEIDGVALACVSGYFPSSQARTEVKVAETALAVADGADEIDIIMHLGKYLSGDYESVDDEISEIKEACNGAKLKVILETGCLPTYSDIKKASIISMYAGADYIKTSTGKEKVAATPEAAYIMCTAIKEYHEKTGIQIGFKPAGGINSVRDALTYYTIVKEVLGEKWLTNEWFRLGTSRLANMLLSDLCEKEVKYF